MAGEHGLRKQLLNATALILEPIISFAVKHAINIQDFNAITKRIYVKAAHRELLRNNEKINVSRISAMTGLTRDAVKAIQDEDPDVELPTASVATRVLGRWQEDVRFCTKAGKPRVLTLKGHNSEFAELVRMVSTHIRPAVVARELIRLKAAVRTKNGIKFRTQVLPGSENIEDGFKLLGRDLRLLTTAVEENLLNRQRISNLHLHTEYDNIVESALPIIRNWLIDEGKRFHRKARELLSSYDRDLNPELEGEAGKAVYLCSVGFSSPLPPPEEAEPLGNTEGT